MALQFVTFCQAEEIPAGSREVFDVGTMSILLLNVDGQFFAVENLCSHEEYELADGIVDGCSLECPKHGAMFDLRNGNPLSTPAYSPIKVFNTQVVDGDVQVELDI